MPINTQRFTLPQTLGVLSNIKSEWDARDSVQVTADAAKFAVHLEESGLA